MLSWVAVTLPLPVFFGAGVGVGVGVAVGVGVISVKSPVSAFTSAPSTDIHLASE